MFGDIKPINTFLPWLPFYRSQIIVQPSWIIEKMHINMPDVVLLVLTDLLKSQISYNVLDLPLCVRWRALNAIFWPNFSSFKITNLSVTLDDLLFDYNNFVCYRLTGILKYLFPIYAKWKNPNREYPEYKIKKSIAAILPYTDRLKKVADQKFVEWIISTAIENNIEPDPISMAYAVGSDAITNASLLPLYLMPHNQWFNVDHSAPLSKYVTVDDIIDRIEIDNLTPIDILILHGILHDMSYDEIIQMHKDIEHKGVESLLELTDEIFEALFHNVRLPSMSPYLSNVDNKIKAKTLTLSEKSNTIGRYQTVTFFTVLSKKGYLMQYSDYMPIVTGTYLKNNERQKFYMFLFRSLIKDRAVVYNLLQTRPRYLYSFLKSIWNVADQQEKWQIFKYFPIPIALLLWFDVQEVVSKQVIEIMVNSTWYENDEVLIALIIYAMQDDIQGNIYEVAKEKCAFLSNYHINVDVGQVLRTIAALRRQQKTNAK